MEEQQEEQKGLVINPVFQPIFIDEIDTPRYYQLYGVVVAENLS